MAKKAKRLVSEKPYTAIDCRRLLHIALFSTGTSTTESESHNHRYFRIIYGGESH